MRRGGAAELSMGDVAAEAGVSKALVLYHFRDKDSLLSALVEDVGAEMLQRADAPLASGAPLDAHWAWLDRELATGDLHVLAMLAECNSEPARAAARRIAEARRIAAARQVEEVFQRLGLTSRMPSELVAETLLAFADGLAGQHALGILRDPRAAYDVLWLALLTLVE